MELNFEEKKVLNFLCEEGYSNPKIADRICKSVKSVEKIVTRLLRIWGVKRREELIVKYWKVKCEEK